MNLMNPYLIDTINSNIRSNELASMPKWARDEKLYNCNPPINKKRNASIKKNTKRLFWRPIVNNR